MSAVKAGSQTTVSRLGGVSGKGIHTGQDCTITVGPAPAGSGIRFYKNGRRLDGIAKDSARRTALGRGDQRVETVEHLLAAFAGLQIDNAAVEVLGPEVPAMDGSAKDFVHFLKPLGIRRQGQSRKVYRLKEPIFCYDKSKALLAWPADDLQIAYVLDYGQAGLKGQIVDFKISPGVFTRQIAPARTFCSEAEAAQLKRLGFGLGANYKNTLVMSSRGPVQNKLRYPDECARHKVLDLIGDLQLLGFPLRARIIGLRSGHQLNRQLVEAIRKQRL